MAKLRQAVDGHYYVQQNIFGQGIATYQIKPEGVRYLATKGIYVDDEILPAYMKRMRDAGFAYTGGSGLGQVNFTTTTPDLDFEKVTFVLRETRITWNLGIYVPGLSTDLIAAIASKGLTAKLSLSVNGNSMPVARLSSEDSCVTSGAPLQLPSRPYPWTIVGGSEGPLSRCSGIQCLPCHRPHRRRVDIESVNPESSSKRAEQREWHHRNPPD